MVPDALNALRIGLTGGIGSGKSTVAKMLVGCGAVLVDTDAIAHALTAPDGAALPQLSQEFGANIVGADGAMDRDRMRAVVFADSSAKRRLEGILHPMIGEEAMRQASAAGDNPVVFDVPLLAASSHWRQRVARVLVVDCLESTQVQRVMQRSGWSEAQVQRVIDQQSARALRRSIADGIIFNDGISPSTLQAEVGALWQSWNSTPHGCAAGL